MAFSQNSNANNSSQSCSTQCAQNSVETMFPLRHATTLACVALTKEMDDYDQRFFRSCSNVDDYGNALFERFNLPGMYSTMNSMDEVNYNTSVPKLQMFDSMEFEPGFNYNYETSIENTIPENLWDQINSSEENKELKPNFLDVLMRDLTNINKEISSSKTEIESKIASYPSEEIDISTIPLDENGMLTSIGSINHSLGTCRPCAFTNNSRKEGCVNGLKCAFCHFKHPIKKRLPRLSKHLRLLKKNDKAKLLKEAGEKSEIKPQNSDIMQVLNTPFQVYF